MTIFLILVPYGVYTVLMMLTSATISVFVASAICLATIAIDVACGRSVKILAAGSAILFAGIGLTLVLFDPKLGSLGVKLGRYRHLRHLVRLDAGAPALHAAIRG